MQKYIARIMPFIMLGIALVAFALGVMILVYVFAIGAIVGCLLFAVAWIRNRFFAREKRIFVPKRGRTIDHE
jgi:hypothetical protein